MSQLPVGCCRRPTVEFDGPEEQALATRGGPVQSYAVPLNVVLFLASFWTAVIYGFATQDWLGAVLVVTVGTMALTSERLTPARLDDDDAR
jgi:hypothetical protein